MIGEADLNQEEIGGPRVDRDTPGRPQEENTYTTHPSSAGEAPQDKPQAQIEVAIESEADREAEVRKIIQKRERKRHERLQG